MGCEQARSELVVRIEVDDDALEVDLQRDFLLATQEHHCPEIPVPARDNAEQRHRDDGRFGKRNEYFPQQLQLACAVHLGGFLEGFRHGFEEVSQQDDIEGAGREPDDDTKAAVEQAEIPHVQEEGDHAGMKPEREGNRDIEERATAQTPA